MRFALRAVGSIFGRMVCIASIVIHLKLLILINRVSSLPQINEAGRTDERANQIEWLGHNEAIFLEEEVSLAERRNRGVNFMSGPIK